MGHPAAGRVDLLNHEVAEYLVRVECTARILFRTPLLESAFVCNELNNVPDMLVLAFCESVYDPGGIFRGGNCSKVE